MRHGSRQLPGPHALDNVIDGALVVEEGLLVQHPVAHAPFQCSYSARLLPDGIATYCALQNHSISSRAPSWICRRCWRSASAPVMTSMSWPASPRRIVSR